MSKIDIEKKYISFKLEDKPWRNYVKAYFIITNNTKSDQRFFKEIIKAMVPKHAVTLKEINDIAKHFASKYRKQFPILTNKDKQNIKLINNEISKRTYYGVREEYAEKPGIKVSWSNGGASWFPWGEVRKGEFVRLDANEMYLPITRTDFERVKLHLDDLPLYRLSFEAKQKGIAPKNVTEIWAMLQREKIERERGI